MRKKGFTGTEALKWVLGLFVLFVILYVLFGPKELFAQTKDTLFNFVYIFVPEEKAPQVELKSRIPVALEKSYDNLVSKIKNSGQGEVCRIEIGEVPKTGEFSIAFYTDKIHIEKKSEKGLTPSEKTEAIEGLKPCAVKGDKASRFYYCLSNSIGCTDAYEEGNFIIDKD